MTERRRKTTMGLLIHGKRGGRKRKLSNERKQGLWNLPKKNRKKFFFKRSKEPDQNHILVVVIRPYTNGCFQFLEKGRRTTGLQNLL